MVSQERGTQVNIDPDPGHNFCVVDNEPHVSLHIMGAEAYVT